MLFCKSNMKAKNITLKNPKFHIYVWRLEKRLMYKCRLSALIPTKGDNLAFINFMLLGFDQVSISDSIKKCFW